MIIVPVLKGPEIGGVKIAVIKVTAVTSANNIELIKPTVFNVFDSLLFLTVISLILFRQPHSDHFIIL